MHLISTKKQKIYDAAIVISIIATVIITYICLTHQICEVFPYFYILPIVLLSFSRPKIGIYGTVLIGWMYIALIFLIGPHEIRQYILATIWFYIIVSLGILLSMYSQYYRKERERSCGIFFNSQAGVFIFNKENLLISNANHKFRTLLHFEDWKFGKKTLPDIIPDSMERETFLTKLHDQHHVGDIEVRFRSSDGSVRWALVSAADTSQPEVICTVVDITDTRLAQEAMTLANRKLNLLNNVTRHDILNQLTALIGYLQLSKDDTHDQKMLSYIAKEEHAAEAIKQQILFTRDYQNIGVRSPQWQSIEEVISLAMAAFDLTGVRMTINVPQVRIYADPLLGKVFYNLLDNSLRHGENVTEITINAEENDNWLDIVYGDNGAGIPEKEKDRIFKREYFKNTGFGLFLSREILGITNLTIVEAGIPEQGARFIIHVPREAYRSSF
jgi:PAS domain S-box-containing protein